MFTEEEVISFVNTLGDNRTLDDSDKNNIGWINVFRNPKGEDFKTTKQLLMDWIEGKEI